MPRDEFKFHRFMHDEDSIIEEKDETVSLKK